MTSRRAPRTPIPRWAAARAAAVHAATDADVAADDDTAARRISG